MPYLKSALLSFNRGLISSLALARVDLARVALAAETMTNWIPRVLGSMALRPGFKYITSTLSNNTAKYLPFVFATDDTALIEFTDSNMRVIIDDVVLTRPAVTSAVTNGEFTSNLTGWTDNDEAGATSAWLTGGYMRLSSNGTAAAIRDQQVTTVETGTEHALRVIVTSGPVLFSVGSTAGAEDYVSSTSLEEGEHSLSFTPTGDFHIRILSRLFRNIELDSCVVESSGVASLTSPFLEADLDNLRTDTSGDVIFIACEGFQQYKIERRATRSWSIVKYLSTDGPYLIENLTPTTITPSALVGNITLTASTPIFRTEDVGEIFSITSLGQLVTASIVAENNFTDPVRITGVGDSRNFNVSITGLTGTGSSVTVQRSTVAPTGPWVDTIFAKETVDVDYVYSFDNLDNQTVYYRLGVQTGDYVAGTIICSIDYSSGSIMGVARITGYTSDVVVDAEVLSTLGTINETTVWAEGAWSDYRGWPTAVVFHEGRLWWAGRNGIWGSVSDDYYNYSPDVIGDSGAIDRTIGSGPVDVVNWIMSLDGLLLGTAAFEFEAKTSDLGEILTPTSFYPKKIGNQGSGKVMPIEVDGAGVFVNRSAIRLYEIGDQGLESRISDLTALVPSLGKPAIVRMASHRQPDTRIHGIRSDGTVMMSSLDKNEKVLAWLELETDGQIEDVVTLPALAGNTDDQVYYVIKRTINGSDVRFLEKWAQEDECIGGQLNMQADSYVEYTGAGTTTISAAHLEGESVVVWADGADIGTDSNGDQIYSVTGGVVTLPNTVLNAVVGLSYTAQFKSTKLGVATQKSGTPLNVEKKVNHIGVIAENIHKKGIKFGPDFDNLDDMPEIEQGTNVTDEVRSTYDEERIEFDGVWTTDARVCIQAAAPRPVTLLALTYELEQ